MTTPDERSRAIYWAGCLLVHLNDNIDVPLKVRRAAHGISRHFPAVEQLEGFDLLKHWNGAGVFETPRDHSAWQEAALGPPLTGGTRLRWPEAVAKSSGDVAGDAGDDVEGETSIDAMIENIAASRQRLAQESEALFALLMEGHPDFETLIRQLGWDAQAAARWTCQLSFDERTQSAAELLHGGRADEVLEKLRRLLHGLLA